MVEVCSSSVFGCLPMCRSHYGPQHHVHTWTHACTVRKLFVASKGQIWRQKLEVRVGELKDRSQVPLLPRCGLSANQVEKCTCTK